MANDPRDKDGKKLQRALHLLGRNVPLRRQFIEFIKNTEHIIEIDTSVRDDITGPIVDALHNKDDIYEKSLSDGTRFKFLFRTKIARDFIMAEKDHPSHVWEPQTTRLLLDLATGLQKDVLVGGAYFGDQAVLTAKKLSAFKRTIHCFEPNLEQAAMLKENFIINNLNNFKINTLGLWSESNVHMKLDGFDSFANAIKANPGDDGFKTTSIDDYQKQFNIEIGLIQLDIEGAELKTLQGAARTISKFKPHIICEIHKDYVDWTNGLKNTALCKLLLEAGYIILAIRDFNSHYEMDDKPIELIPMNKIYLEGPPHGFNLLAVRDISIVTTPLYKIVENVSPKLLLHKDPLLHHPTDCP